eukprot:TRINITY_DN103825_c0_g1_i1.p1 TRINITY_DN103825_c0_g1~~TRINITY_DN103825_c0_g1_i1.p1  ORF type:complete len:324 (+),score=32.90 TRINITY_DN103825_c0_g1_i1:76-1047(+)
MAPGPSDAASVVPDTPESKMSSQVVPFNKEELTLPPSPADNPKQLQELSDEPYSIAQICQSDGFEASVPETMYGAVGVLPIAGEVRTFDDFVGYFGLLLNNGIQMAFLYGINEIATSAQADIATGECDRLELAPWLVVICVLVYLFYLLNEVEATLVLAELYLDAIPTVAGHSKILKFKGDDKQFVSGGLSFLRKAMLITFVVVPRLLIAICLGYVGTYYLASSLSDADLLLNAMALVFVIDIDELIYQAIYPTSVRRVMCHMPSFKVQDRRTVWKILDRYSAVLKLAICTVACVLSITVFPVCGYPGGAFQGYEEPTGKPAR